jgi:uncharacterized protein (DUF1684 family)
MINADPFKIAHWRREMGELYAEVRAMPQYKAERAAREFRRARDVLFLTHASSPIPNDIRSRFVGLKYYPFDHTMRAIGKMDRDVKQEQFKIDFPKGERNKFTRVGRVSFSLRGIAMMLSVYWYEGYYGGLFLPFRDATNDKTTYAQGRYLYETVIGADLGITGDRIVLDFNYAYNPPCAYDARVKCALAPDENRLAFAIEAGEKNFAIE